MRCRNDCPPDFGAIEIAVPATGIPANVQAPASAFETAVAANAGDAAVETAVAADPQDAAPPPRKMQRPQRSQQMRPRRLHCGLVWTGGRLRPVSCHANAETAVAASITRSDSQPEHMRKPQLRQTPPGLPCIMWSYATVKQAARAYNDAQQCRGAECRPCFRMARFCHGRRSKDEVKRPGGSKRQRTEKWLARTAQSLDAAVEDADRDCPAEVVAALCKHHIYASESVPAARTFPAAVAGVSTPCAVADVNVACETGALPTGSIEEREANVLRLKNAEIDYLSKHFERGGGETIDVIQKVRWYRSEIQREEQIVEGMRWYSADVLDQLDDVLTEHAKQTNIQTADTLEQLERLTPHPPQPLCATAKACFPKKMNLQNSLNFESNIDHSCGTKT